MLPLLIKQILALPPDGRDVTVRGWVRTARKLKRLVFVEVNDGSSLAGIQCTWDRDPSLEAAEALLARLGTGVSVEIRGRLTSSPGGGQAVELQAEDIAVLGDAPEYPLQKKGHTLEFLREIAHLRPRTNTFAAVARVRSRLAQGIHRFFDDRLFQYIHTPIITASDAEGAGAMFQVTTLNLDTLNGRPPDYSGDFFGKRSALTVSGQLEAETYAAALSRVYTFGPTFRAENSNTTRHLAEFWMIEPEAAFFTLEDNMALAEDFLKSLLNLALQDCAEDLAFFESRYEKSLTATLRAVSEASFARLSYTEAVAELERHADAFQFKPYWGCDLQSEHERFLTEEIAGGPVIVTDYPRDIKAFYMKQNEDGRTVRAMDLLVPRLGEIIGGSEREADYGRLVARMEEMGMRVEDYRWYLDLRRYGTVPHSGFGMGFERLIQYVTGMANIRDVIPFPRAAGQADY